MNILFKFFLFFLFLNINSTNAQNIFTFAGTGLNNNSGDGGLATLAGIFQPADVAIDTAGNIYILAYNTIRMVNASGLISTIAGGGATQGDGGPATMAQISGAGGLVCDRHGNIYIADFWNNRIRMIDNMGIINTIVGGGASTSDGIPGNSASIYHPYDLTIDKAGNIYFIDSQRIRKLNTTGIISTVGGGGSVLGDGGPATSAQFLNPSGITLDSIGNIYVSDCDHHRVRKIDISGTISTIAGDGTQGNSGDSGMATSAQIGNPSGIKVDPLGNIYIVDYWYSTIRKINTFGVINTIAGTGSSGFSGDGGPAIFAQINPVNFAISSLGNIYLADGTNHRVRIICINACTVGLNAQDKVNLIVYPNPAISTLYINAEQNNFENAELEVINYLGQCILKHSFSNSIDISKLPYGIYTLKIKVKNDQSYFSKFVKE